MKKTQVIAVDRLQKKQIKTLNKEFRALQHKEDKLMAAALKARQPGWKKALEAKVPEKVYAGLNSAFAKGFSLVFQHGRKVIELTYKKEKAAQNYAARNEGFRSSGNRKEVKQIHKSAGKSNKVNLVMTTVEGIGLGALGIGMPDIVLFLSTVLRGVYKTALHYGFGYESRFEQMLILKMMAASLSAGEDWFHRNKEVNDWILAGEKWVSDADFQAQIQDTAAVFAVDMLLLKFIQGLPVVGLLGGAANPLYYHKIMQYTQLKYKRRYLLNHQINL